MKRISEVIDRFLVRLGLRKPIRFDRRGNPISVMGKRIGIVFAQEDVKRGDAVTADGELMWDLIDPNHKHEGQYTGMHFFNDDGYAGEAFNCKVCGQLVMGEKTLPEDHEWLRGKACENSAT